MEVGGYAIRISGDINSEVCAREAVRWDGKKELGAVVQDSAAAPTDCGTERWHIRTLSLFLSPTYRFLCTFST